MNEPGLATVVMATMIDIEKKDAIEARPYIDLIKEVYIDPIRSAIIVDDSYPTLDLLLDASAEGISKLKTRDPSGLSKIVDSCRSKEKPWLVDVHDGSGLEELDEANQHFKRLHQSDLMILDYSLDGDDGGNHKVCNILKSLTSNNYFNLVIIYTKRSDNDLSQCVAELARSLTFQAPEYELSKPLNVPEVFTLWENEGIYNNLKDQLLNALTGPLFLKLFQEKNYGAWIEIIKNSGLEELFQDRTTPPEQCLIPVLKWLLSIKYREYSHSMSPTDLQKVEFNIDLENWIRTETLFVTVISKEIAPNELTDRLLAALAASDPSPHRLLMSKIRTILDEKGVTAERSILDKKYMQAGWLKEMLGAKESDERDWKIKRTVIHHWEELASHVSHDIKKYANELLITILKQEADNIQKIIQRFTSIDILNVIQLEEVLREWNSFVCSKEVDGHHLLTGHILEITTSKAEQADLVELWVCLTPVCDLAPRDANKLWGDKDLKGVNLIPFKAVKLIEYDIKKGLKDATKNEYIFIDSGSGTKCYKYSNSFNTSPTWDQFFAHNSGKFGDDKTLTLSSINLINDDGIRASTVNHIAKLTNQLRYEYALHLLQKLGGTFSRIGLEFVPLISPQAQAQKPQK